MAFSEGKRATRDDGRLVGGSIVTLDENGDTLTISLTTTPDSLFTVKHCNDVASLPIELVEECLRDAVDTPTTEDCPGLSELVATHRPNAESEVVYISHATYMREMMFGSKGLYKAIKSVKAIKFWAISTALQLYPEDAFNFVESVILSATMNPPEVPEGKTFSWQLHDTDLLFDRANAEKPKIAGFLGRLKVNQRWLFDISTPEMRQLISRMPDNIGSLAMERRIGGKSASVKVDSESPAIGTDDWFQKGGFKGLAADEWYKDPLWVYLMTESPDFVMLESAVAALKDKKVQRSAKPTPHSEFVVPLLDAKKEVIWNREWWVPAAPTLPQELTNIVR